MTLRKTQPAKQEAEFLSAQIKTLRLELESAQKKLSDYQQRNGIVAADERNDVESARLNELSQQLVLAQANAAQASGQARYSNGGSSSIAEVANSPLIAGLRADVVRQESELEQMSKTLGPNHPTYQQKQAQVNATNSRLKRELAAGSSSMGASSQAAAARVSQIRADLETQRQRVLHFNQQRDEMAVLTREVATAQHTYDLASQRYSQVNVESQVNQTNISILNPAVVPADPSRPQIGLNFAVSLIAGIFFGVVLALVIEFLDRRVRAIDDAVQFVGAPVIGVLPGGNPTKRLPAQNYLALPSASKRLPRPA